MAIGQRARNLGISVGFHAAIGALIFFLAGSQIFSVAEKEVYVEMEFLEPEVPEPVPEAPSVDKPEIPTEDRPQVVPEKVVTRVQDKPRPFQPETKTEEGALDAPDDAEAIPLPTTTLTFAMTETVGGSSGLEYESTIGGSIALPPPGPAGGSLGTSDSPGAANVKVARDWQITRQAMPTNDRGFEPNYPALAKRQGREALILVRIDIDKTGRVVRAEAVEGPSQHGFREAAVAYAKKLTFSPAMSGDNAVASRIDWSVHFYVRN